MTEPAFTTPSGTAVPAVTADGMRAVDRVAVEEVGLGLLGMMENAGRTLAWHVRDVGDGPVLVVAGGGGNGGGGLACARHLANRDVPVTVVLDREPEALTGAAARQFGILEEMGVPVDHGPDALDGAGEPDVLVDALVGYGLRGQLREPARRVVGWLDDRRAPAVSLDVPSGVDATTGAVRGRAVSPARTVTLALPKTGIVDRPEPTYLADIGIPGVVYDRLDVEYENPFGRRPWVELRPGNHAVTGQR